MIVRYLGQRETLLARDKKEYRTRLLVNLFPHIQQGSIFPPGKFAHKFVIHNPGFSRINCMRHTGNPANSQHRNLLLITIHIEMDLTAAVLHWLWIQVIQFHHPANKLGNIRITSKLQFSAISSSYQLIIPEYIKPLNRFLGATIPENESQSKSMILFQ